MLAAFQKAFTISYPIAHLMEILPVATVIAFLSDPFIKMAEGESIKVTTCDRFAFKAADVEKHTTILLALQVS